MRFRQRNRLIAAASQATVILEAGWRSGSLNTAGHAGQLGRPLGAVPGPVTSAASAGCHRLIRDYAAVLVTTPDEMAELAPLGEQQSLVRTPPPKPVREPQRPRGDVRLLDAMSFVSPRTATDIATRAGYSVEIAQAMLGTHELEGLVGERERGWVRVKPKD
jgi:DNA processing protein